MLFTIQLAVLYPSEYEVKVWVNTIITSEKPVWILNTKSINEALETVKILDSFLKAIDNLGED